MCAMQMARLGAVELEFQTFGSGEPLLLIHGCVLADALLPLVGQPALAGYQLIHYHRRGFNGSSPYQVPFDMSSQAADARLLLDHLGITSAHIAGHSFGAAMALQLALDAPERVATLTLLEAPLLPAVAGAAGYLEWMLKMLVKYQSGLKPDALEFCMRRTFGDDFRQRLSNILSPDVMENAYRDADTFFLSELPAMQRWNFTENQVRRVKHPVLAVSGSESQPVYEE